MQISVENYLKLLDEGYSLDILYILQQIKDGIDISDEILHPKFGLTYQFIQRKELISDGVLTLKGEEVLSYIDNKPKKVKTKSTEEFILWWNTYPSTNMFVYNNKTFPGVQSKKIKKEDCKRLFNKLLNEKYSAEDIIKATEYHFKTAKELSFKTGKNELSYIPNSERYLREKMFEPYISLYKQNIKSENKIDSIDI